MSASPKLNTSRSRQVAKKVLQRIRLRYLAHRDIARFSRTASFSVFDSSADQVESRIMYNVHALEKGIARRQDRRLGFGKKALANLNDALVMHRRLGFACTGFAYVEGLSVIQRYRELHDEAGFDTSYVEDLVDPEFLHPEGGNFSAAGSKTLTRADKAGNGTKDFYSLAQGRCSVREFSGDPIDPQRVMRALRNAEKTPSVCNRQGWRVHWVDDPEMSRVVLEHQRGFGYPQLPEILLAITVTNASYLSPVERNQAFIDGGLFSMSVLYGLEYEGLAVVPLNAMMYSRDEDAVRGILRVGDAEMIVMFIAIGAFPETTTVPVSDRRPVELFLRGGPPRLDASPLPMGMIE